MITIITTKIWKRLQADNLRMREALDRYDEVVKNLIRRVAKLEKEVNDAKRENRRINSDIRIMEKQKTKQ